MNIKIKLHIKKQQQQKAYLENPWNLISLSSVHISLRDWPHMKQFATQEGKKTRNPLTFVTCFLLYIFQEDRASKEKTPQRKHLLDIQYHRGVGLLLILLVIVEQNLLTTHHHILQMLQRQMRGLVKPLSA